MWAATADRGAGRRGCATAAVAVASGVVPFCAQAAVASGASDSTSAGSGGRRDWIVACLRRVLLVLLRLRALDGWRPVESIALQFLESSKGCGEGTAIGGAVAQEQVRGELGVLGAKKGEQLAAGRRDQREFFVDVRSLAVHLHLIERTFHVGDAAVAPGGGDHLFHEFILDAVDGLETPVEVDYVLVIVAWILV